MDANKFWQNKNLKALLLYVVLTLIFTWPLLPHITTHYPSTFYGEGGDPNMYIWFMDTVAQKVAHPSFHPSNMIFYPQGINFMAGYEAPIMLVISTPIILLTHNPILAYNIVLLLAFILTCYVCYLLILYLTRSYFASLITGFSFGLSPYMMVRGVQHIDLLLLFTVPWVVLCAFKFVDNPNRRNIAILALSIFITALSAWYYLVGCFIFLGLLLLFNFRKFWTNKRIYFEAAAAVALAILVPAIPMFIFRSNSAFHYVDILIETRGADPLNFFVPHPYMYQWTWGIYKYFISPYEATSYFGIVGIIAIFTLVFGRRQIDIRNRRLWIMSMIVFIVLALGVHFYIFHHQISLPFEFLRKFIPFSRLRAPNRFFVFAYLATTVIFGYFLAYLQTTIKKPKTLWAITIIILALLVSERSMIPYPILSMPVSEFYKNIGKDGQNYSIVDIPFINPGLSLYNYYQIYHGKPIVDGEYFWTAYTNQTFDFARNNELLFNSVPSEGARVPQVDKAKALKQLADANIRDVIVHNFILNNFSNDDVKMIKFIHIFFRDQKPVFADGDITVYSTSPK